MRWLEARIWQIIRLWKPQKLLWLIDLFSFLALPVLIPFHSLVKFRGWFSKKYLIDEETSLSHRHHLCCLFNWQMSMYEKRQQSHFFLFAYTHAKYNLWDIPIYILKAAHLHACGQWNEKSRWIVVLPLFFYNLFNTSFLLFFFIKHSLFTYKFLPRIWVVKVLKT